MQAPAARHETGDRLPAVQAGARLPALEADEALAALPHDWPHRHLSRFVDAAGVRWHVQCAGDGTRPVLLLLHGTGTAASSWRDLVAPLAADFTVVAPDLPGHGFTSALPTEVARLDDMASALATLMRTLGLAPDFIVGHSAGAAISARMALAETPGVRRLVWLAGALCPLGGLVGRVASPLAHVLARSPLVARLAAWRASDAAAVERFIAATGSTLDARGLSIYRALLRRPSHVAGALAMMAGWDLVPLQRALPTLSTPVLLLHGDADRTVPPAQSDELAHRLPHARVTHLSTLGHLAHEERPAEVTRLIRDWLVPL
ncbi:MAG TPA: alpha/beta fold hydrolase BchO [Burkholderiaceae bacterium]|nr:alpha/beta fold hydrolase BchO [Burkholderiaceae bacterium]